MKSEIIDRLGQADLLLPSRVAEGLAANDRVKLRLSVLQAAVQRACEPTSARFDLTDECRAAGVDPVALEALVNHATLSVGDRISAPGLGSLATAIWDDAEAMIHAVGAGDQDQADKAEKRLSTIRALTPIGSSDDVELRQITQLTGLGGDDDSFHRLVMDLHKALNRLAATYAQETLAGAHVYGLLSDDRPAIEAFMRGVEATKKLKFGHPGLATTATRTGGRLTI